MVPAHFHNVRPYRQNDDKMKSDLVKILQDHTLESRNTKQTNADQIRVKHDVRRSLSEFWTIEKFPYICDQIISPRQHHESVPAHFHDVI